MQHPHNAGPARPARPTGGRGRNLYTAHHSSTQRGQVQTFAPAPRGETIRFPAAPAPNYSAPAPAGRRRRKKRPVLVILALAAAGVLGISLGLALWPNGTRPTGGVTRTNLTGDLATPTGAIAGPPYIVALDAGHGGNDVGAEGLVNEPELTEPTVAALYRLLEADPLFTPVLCRAFDEGATPKQRAKAAQKAGAVLLFSVHGNSDASPDSHGFECFPVTPGRPWHSESLTLANYVAAEMANAGARLRGEGGVRYVYYEDDQKVFREASDTNVYPAETFTVVERPGCIALLVEQCFVTSPQDMARFGGEAGCSLAAQCYYQAISRFFGELAG